MKKISADFPSLRYHCLAIFSVSLIRALWLVALAEVGGGKHGFEGRTVCPKSHLSRGSRLGDQQEFGVAAWLLWGTAQPGESGTVGRAALWHGSVLTCINYINHPPG